MSTAAPSVSVHIRIERRVGTTRTCTRQGPHVSPLSMSHPLSVRFSWGLGSTPKRSGEHWRGDALSGETAGRAGPGRRAHRGVVRSGVALFAPEVVGSGDHTKGGHGIAADWLGALSGSSTGAAQGRLAAAARAADSGCPGGVSDILRNLGPTWGGSARWTRLQKARGLAIRFEDSSAVSVGPMAQAARCRPSDGDRARTGIRFGSLVGKHPHADLRDRVLWRVLAGAWLSDSNALMT